MVLFFLAAGLSCLFWANKSGKNKIGAKSVNSNLVWSSMFVKTFVQFFLFFGFCYCYVYAPKKCAGYAYENILPYEYRMSKWTVYKPFTAVCTIATMRAVLVIFPFSVLFDTCKVYRSFFFNNNFGIANIYHGGTNPLVSDSDNMTPHSACVSLRSGRLPIYSK